MLISRLLYLTSFIAVVTSSSTSACNPISASCSADKALATTYSEDFTTNSSYFETYKFGEQVHYTDEGLKLTLAQRFDNPSIVSKEYILFGRVEALVKAANGTGIISTIYLQSDVLDEIDWEWFGGDGSQVATDFFYEGRTTTYDRGTYYDMADPRGDFHNYTLDWTESEITWYVDGKVARTLKNTTDEGYPQTPSKLYIGIWAGGDSSNAEGTIEWAGGSTDYSEAPFNMYVKKLVVTDYSSGSEYSYTERSGDLSSIEAIDGEVNGDYEDAILEYDQSSISDSSLVASKSQGSISHVSHTSSLAAEEVSAGVNSVSSSVTSNGSGFSISLKTFSKTSSTSKSTTDSTGGVAKLEPIGFWDVSSLSVVLLIVGLL